jgi:hypothetical protein
MIAGGLRWTPPDPVNRPAPPERALPTANTGGLMGAPAVDISLTEPEVGRCRLTSR